MSDIVERCRKNQCKENTGCNTNPFCSCVDLEDAADHILELEARLAAAEADAGRWLKVSEHEPPYGEHILIALRLIRGDWFICYGFVQSDWSLWSVDDDSIGYDLDDDAYWKRVKPPIDSARSATAPEAGED